MTHAAKSLLDELKQLRREGVSSIPVSDETLARLRQTKTKTKAKAGHSSPSQQADTGKKTAQAAKGSTQNAGVRSGRRELAPDFANLVSDMEKGKVQSSPSRPPKLIRPKGLPPGFEIEPIPTPPQFELPKAASKPDRLEWLRERVLGCPVCRGRVREGKQVVFGVGSVDAEIFFCGEAPGAEEEHQGEPFVGPAGQLLTKVIKAMGLSREQVYIGNIMNWRPEMPTPTGNRPPSQEEMAFCLPYLRAQIEIVQPKVIVALGLTAVNGLLGFDPQRRLGPMRGSWEEFEGIPLRVSYHPSYVLRNETKVIKRQLWEDMLAVMEKTGLSISDKQRGFFA